MPRTTRLSKRLSDLNDKHFLTVEGGKTIIISEGYDPALHRKVWQRSTPEDIRVRYGNELFNTKRGRKALGQLWLEWGQRKTYPGMVFAPGEPNPTLNGYFNFWGGFAVTPVKGDWSLLKDHIQYVITNGNADQFDYLLKWMAYAVQFPSKMPQVAVVLRGGEGTGKGTFVEAFGGLFGTHYLKMSNSKQLTGQFGGHLENVLVAFADEAVVARDQNSIGVLKGYITESLITIERKHQQAHTVNSHLHILMASNNDWVVPSSNDARRFFVLDVNDSHKGDMEYFDAIRQQLAEGGQAAMLYDLLKVDLSGWRPQVFPVTQGLADQKLASLDAYGKWWHSALVEGAIGDYRWGDGPLVVPIGEMAQDIQNKERYLKEVPRQTLHVRMKAMLRKALVNGPKMNGHKTWLLPPLDQSRAAFEGWLGHSISWGDSGWEDSEDSDGNGENVGPLQNHPIY